MTLAQEVAPNDAGWMWPVIDTQTWHWVAEVEPDVPAFVMGHVPEKKVCVQAGGNCGFYVFDYAREFETVYTFEPQAAAFRCLVHNVPAPNAYFYRAALGERPGLAQVVLADPSHCGTAQVTEVNGDLIEGNAVIPVLRLDDFFLRRVDLIHLDVEGYELKALAGADETIRRCRPVIALEINGRCEEFGWSPEMVVAYMRALGYYERDHFRHEHVFLPGEKTSVV